MWGKEFVIQNLKNVVKRFLVPIAIGISKKKYFLFPFPLEKVSEGWMRQEKVSRQTCLLRFLRVRTLSDR
jgi:hypothetical protein